MVDVGQAPELKNAFLGGQINVAVCPKCGTGGLIAAPMVYHDPQKQFYFALIPQEINMPAAEQEKFLGMMTKMVMQGLPNDAPKGYMLNPKRFLTVPTMLDAVLEGEGITKEQLQAQRNRSMLLGNLLEADADEAALAQLVAEHKAELDYEFFMTLTAYIQASQEAGDTASATRLEAFRDRLVEMTGIGLEGEEAGTEEIEAAVDALLKADEADVAQVIAEHRPALDYGFFEMLTARAEAARAAGDGVEAERIEARRMLVLETAEQMDRDAQELFDGAAQTLTALLQAPELRTALEEQREALNEAFMLVLAANKESAERNGNQDLVERLQEIERLAVQVIQDSLPPDERLINQLLNAETPKDATTLLRQSTAIVTTDFVKRINTLAAEMDQANRKEVADRLRQLGREATSMLF
ncbi:MAG: CpXC domain-containing protein [Herpetosiphon sp.]